MYKIKEKKQEYVEKIFNDSCLFEAEVLNVSSAEDKIEIMKILAKIIVRDKLKNELNFLYIKNLSDFKLSSLLNALFAEVANEWVSFAVEDLSISASESIEYIKNAKNANFIYSIVMDYIRNYNQYIFEEIANTFIELVDITPHAKSNKIVDEVLNSEFMTDKNILAMHNANQLWSKVKAARNTKNAQRSRIQIKISDKRVELHNTNLEEQKKEELLEAIGKYEQEEKKLKDTSLDNFDFALKRLKDTMVLSMILWNSK
ncbi:hypothetical protein KKG72_04405 [bacterium]|nr:hypothetical protein [bacterium]MBU1994320.1 hypothetical protein [bacterium]